MHLLEPLNQKEQMLIKLGTLARFPVCNKHNHNHTITHTHMCANTIVLAAVSSDAIFKALQVETEEDMKKLMKYFVAHADEHETKDGGEACQPAQRQQRSKLVSSPRGTNACACVCACVRVCVCARHKCESYPHDNAHQHIFSQPLSTSLDLSRALQCRR